MWPVTKTPCASTSVYEWGTGLVAKKKKKKPLNKQALGHLKTLQLRKIISVLAWNVFDTYSVLLCVKRKFNKCYESVLGPGYK